MDILSTNWNLEFTQAEGTKVSPAYKLLFDILFNVFKQDSESSGLTSHTE